MRNGEERPVAFARLKQLRCYEEVCERLVAGYPCDHVARFIQEEEGEYLHATRRSLAEVLRRFVAKEIAPVEILAPRLPTYIARATREFGDRLEDLRRLERVLEAAQYRLELAHAQEVRSGKINPNVDRHVKVLVDLVWKMHEIKMDLGLSNGRELSALTVSPERLEEIRTRYGEGAARAFADPVQRAQVLGLLKRVMRLSGRSEETDIMSEHGDDGTNATAYQEAAEEAVAERSPNYAASGQDDEDEDEDLWEAP